MPNQSTKLAVVANPADVSASWLTEVLSHAGIKAEVAKFSATNIGTGQVGQNIRFEIEYTTHGSDRPTAIVGKFPSTSQLSRETAIAGGVYLREVSFYQAMAPTLDVQTPKVLFCGVEADEARFCLMMEDLAPAVQGDQIEGCSVDEAALAMIQAARIHAPRWGDTALQGFAWLQQPSSTESLPEEVTFFDDCFKGFSKRYRERLSAEHMEVGRQLGVHYAHWVMGYTGPLALIHCDFRPDNLLFGGPYPLTVVDWQTCSVGAPVYDVSYFLGAGLLPEERRQHERELVALYHNTLLEYGIRDYNFASCWQDYRRHAFSGLRMAIHASMVVGQTARGDDMFMAMASRHAQQVLDLEALEFLGS